ncbi:MAG: pyrroloquinoline quinone biosynthesis peptide chaperone PqqD [Acidobacteria bacterium]|nr:pyrroloquinoline quinone biosynthesis peptide chaperone PqqD [Acidobacteriota bacterium]
MTRSTTRTGSPDVTLTAAAVPALWRLARLEFDPVRQQRVLLYPEGVVLLNDTGGAILDLCDGRRSIADVAAILQERYRRDVTADVIDYLSQLVERELVRVE